MPCRRAAARSTRPRTTVRLLTAAGVLAAASAGVFAVAGPAVAVSPDVVISQVYRGGGNSGASYKNDFIELFNNSQQTVSIDGWSVQYNSATGTNPYQVTALPSGAQIGPDSYYLIAEAAGAAGTTALPTADATGSINMSATVGRVALVTNSTALAAATAATGATVHDFVGFGSTAAISGGLPAVSVGDTATSPVIGVLDFFGNPELQVTTTPTFTAGPLTPAVTTLVPASGAQLSVATYNVENLNPQNPASKFQALAGQIVNNLKSPDLIAVEEVQDNSGVTDDGTVSATTTLSMLTQAISSAGGPAYSTTEIDPANDADGGQPGGNIRQVFLYNPAFVTLVSKPGGGTTTADSVLTNPDGSTDLAQSPGRIDPTNSAWNSSRKPLAAEFTLNATGAKFFAIGNHFVAKLGDSPLFGRYQPPAMSSAQQRVAQATAVNSFVKQLEADPKANVVVLGDFNDYTFSASQQTLRGTQLRDLFATLPANQQYDYVYEGNSQTLDHILVSGPLFSGASFSPVHVNAEFANQTSDHDPEVALTAPAATPSLPEAPVALLVPLAGLLTLAGAFGLRRRRRLN